MSAKKRLVVVGNGMAGARAVEEILERGGADQFEITMFGDEPHGNYNRISLSNVLAGLEDPAAIFLNPLDWYEENAIALHSGVRITRIDRFAREVTADDGTVHPYDKLIIATGSRTFFPPIPALLDSYGRRRAGVFGFRNIADTSQMLEWAERATRVAVIGGGLLGLEAARGLLERNIAVHVVHRSSRLMNMQLDGQAGAILRRGVEDLGVHVHLETSTTRVLVSEDGHVAGLQFGDGSELECDMLVVTAGIRPNVDLAASGGLVVERAIVVDDAMRALDEENIYVVGECAQHRGQVYGLVAPLWEQAVVLADHITGTNTHAAYHGSKVATKLKVSGIDLATMGQVEPEHADDEFIQYAEPKRRVYTAVIVRDGKLVGATLLGDVSKVSFLMQAFDRGMVLPEDRRSLLFDLGAPAAAASVAELSDDAQICNCNGVTKGAIRACVKDGARTMRAVAAATRAGSGCGSCKGQVLEILEWAAGGQLDDDPAADYYVPSIPFAKPELMDLVRERGLRSVSSVIEALGRESPEPKVKPALVSLLKMVWGSEYEDERDARFINDRVHANIQKDGTFSVVPRIAGGVTTSDQLRRLADVADAYKVPMIKITGGQRIDLLGVHKKDLPGVWRDLDMPSGHAYGKSFRTVKTCVGSDFCRFGLGDSTALGIRIEERFAGLESPAKLKLAVAGCPRNCSEAMVKDVGLVAVEGARWEIYVGGAAGAHVRKGDLLCAVDTADRAMVVVGRFIQYYRENARWLERTYAFMDRVGVDSVRAIVIDDRDGDGERLDAELERSLSAYTDPWIEGRQPVTANQFAERLESASATGVSERLAALTQAGTSAWLDQIRRSLTQGGELGRLVEEDSLRGETSNPAIFEKAILGSSDYDEQIDELAGGGALARAIYQEIAIQDVQEAADVLRSVYDSSGGADGFVSLEVDPDLAFFTDRTLDQAREYWGRVARPNAMIKIPGTPEGLPAIEQATYEGININVTLLFSVEAYATVAEAYIRGLERRHDEGLDLGVHSVASFFVSRVDAEVDERLKAIGRTDLAGQAAVANARAAYRRFEEIFRGKRFAALAAAGAPVQRPLWASTGVKNPAYAETKYIEELVGPDTVNTMPMPTLLACAKRLEVRRATVREDPTPALTALAEAGIDMTDVTDKLLLDGIAAFVTPMQNLLTGIEVKRQAILAGRATC
ncbi:MAG: nitrite reductase large subunit NirB [Solirubrobacteraceae bacterium]